MAQSPTIAIPKKSTEEVDWTGPIRTIIKASYGENPDNYATECAALQRCRQDAVRGAGSDLTAASLLTKYFGQLELLELRFPEIRVSFPWRDAFTAKLTTQTSMAFEKASIIYQIAATHSIIASAQNRSDPEGLKRAYYYFRTCAGMLTYINDNFLHAPSTDLSREVVKFLVGITMAQGNETFYETCVDQRKSPALIAKVAAHTTFLYNGLCEEVKEFFGKGIFDRNWVTLLQIKAKYFTSLMQYHRSLADTAAGKHGEALARMGVAESNAKEAHKLAASFSPYFVNTLSTTLPADTGTAILELTKNHLALCTEKYVQGQKDNDLIYNAHVPSEATLPAIDKISAVTPVPIQEVYGSPEVQKTIGPDLFTKLIPLSVHEGASVYSEEKAKIVRAEVEKAEVAEAEAKASLESLGVKSGLGRYKEIAEGEVDASVPSTVLAWQEEIQRKQGIEGVEKQLRELEQLKSNVARDLDAISESLAVESRECETMRVKYGHRWTQEPSGGPAKDLRRDLKEHRSSLEAAAPSDQQIHTLWSSIKPDITLLSSTAQLEGMFASAATGGSAAGDLLDVTDADTDDVEREKMKKLVREVEERMGRLNKITRERNEILKDLKEKVQNDDVSHHLLLNRRNAGNEPNLFATELEKFRPYQTRLAATTHAQQTTIQEIAQMWKSLKDKGGGKNRGAAKKWEEREKRMMALVKRFASARDGYLEVSDGLMKGLQFYKDLTTLTKTLKERSTSFLSGRDRERESLSNRLGVEQRLEATSAPPSAVPPALPPPPPRPLDASFASLSISSPTSATTPHSQSQATTSPAPNAWQQHQRAAPSLSTGVLPLPPLSSYSSAHSPSPPVSSYLPATAPPTVPAVSSYTPLTPQRQGTLNANPMLPPPPPPPSTVPAPAAPPANDPYAGMFSSGLFSSLGSSASPASSAAAAAAPPPPGSVSHFSHHHPSPPPVQSPYGVAQPVSYQSYQQQQPYQQSLPPPPQQQQQQPPQIPSYGHSSTPSQSYSYGNHHHHHQHQHQHATPGPGPGPVPMQGYGGAYQPQPIQPQSPLPPPQQQQQQPYGSASSPPPPQMGYGYGYGSPAYPQSGGPPPAPASAPALAPAPAPSGGSSSSSYGFPPPPTQHSTTYQYPR